MVFSCIFSLKSINWNVRKEGNHQGARSFLVGGIPTPLEKNIKVTWDDEIPNWMKKIKVMFQSPPTRSSIHNQLLWRIIYDPLLSYIYIYYYHTIVGWMTSFVRSSVAECNVSLNLPQAQMRSAWPSISWNVGAGGATTIWATPYLCR